jgi:hypothetical protein
MRRKRRVAAIGAAALVLASAGLFLVSRGKWSDAIIDSGREWIVPDALARGDLLYRDVVYWFGPFTPYFHAAFFRAFGSSFATLVVAGVVGSVGVLVALYFVLCRVTGKPEAALWTALAIPVLIFMPNAGGPILGMGYRIWHAAGFALAAIAVASGPKGRRDTFRTVAAGALCALAGLCRTEWGLVSLVAVVVALTLRSASRPPAVRAAALAITAFLGIFGGTLAIFVLLAGWRTVIVDNHLLLTGLPPETRRFLVAFSGIRDWKTGLAEMAYSAAMWLGIVVLVEMAARGKAFAARKRAPLLVALLLVLGVAATLGGAGGAVVFSGAPLVALGGLVAGVLRRHEPRAAALAASGLAGVVLSYRRPFHIGDSAYVGPPLLFALVCAAGLVQTLIEKEKHSDTRERLLVRCDVALLALVVVAFAGRALGYRSDERVSIPGTRGMLSARAEAVEDLESFVRAVRRDSRPGEGLVVFPEGELLNYLTGRPNPIRHKLYIPGYLTTVNEGEILAELDRSPPRIIGVLPRSTGEYGSGTFGVSYGRRINQWIQRNYRIRPIGARGPGGARRSSAQLGVHVEAPVY